MIAKTPETLDAAREVQWGLSSLERLGAFFTSQIHDLNNQMAVLSNAEMLAPGKNDFTPEGAEFVSGLFASIHRLSATCEKFNAVCKKYPVEVDALTSRETLELIIGAVGDCKGWQAEGHMEEKTHVLVNANWLPIIVSGLIDQMNCEKGTVEIAIGDLPRRQYRQPLRSGILEGPGRVVLVRFQGLEGRERGPAQAESAQFQIVLELVRLLGAGLSLVISDHPNDYLLALRMQA